MKMNNRPCPKVSIISEQEKDILVQKTIEFFNKIFNTYHFNFLHKNDKDLFDLFIVFNEAMEYFA